MDSNAITTAEQSPGTTTLETRQVWIRQIPIHQLLPAPENLELYRPILDDDPDVIALAESVAEEGILQPLDVTADFYIISGHRRHAAARLAGLAAVPCNVLPFNRSDDPEEFLRLLREHNRQRVKTREEMLKEEIVTTSPEDAHRLLSDYRTRNGHTSKKAGGALIEIIGTKHRAAISAAKIPMLLAAKKIIFDLKEIWPLSERVIHYNLLNGPPLRHASKPDSTYRNNKPCSGDLSDLLTRARICGLIPWESIGDDTRPVETWNIFQSAQPYLRRELTDFLRTYWRDLMQSQPHHVEIVCEKNTMLGILKPVASKFTIPITSGRGYCSADPRHEMAERYWASGKHKLIVLMLGDFDPEGENICHSFARCMRDDFGIPDIEPRKVALTADQVKEYHLPPIMEAKEKSSRYDGFVAKHGKTVHELEALPPKTLQSLLEKAVDAVIDKDAFNHEVGQERLDAQFLDRQRQIVLNVLRGLGRADQEGNADE